MSCFRKESVTERSKEILERTMVSSPIVLSPFTPNTIGNGRDDSVDKDGPYTEPVVDPINGTYTVDQGQASNEIVYWKDAKSTPVVGFGKHINQIKERRQKVYDVLKQLEREIKPREFESYAEYYLIKTFKVGKSASGKVNVDGLRSRGSGGPYRRLKRSSQRTNTSSSRNESKSSSDSSIEGDHAASDSDPGLAAKESDTDYKPSNPWKINRDITTASIIEENKSGPIRRSSRLTRKEREKQFNRKKQEGKEGVIDNATESLPDSSSAVIQHLYENLITKVQEPARRSDWLLPPKQRYIPEKNQPVKHEPEQIKINELARNLRIKKILSRFDGGLAGVRTGM